jgi:hypothetical protein
VIFGKERSHDEKLRCLCNIEKGCLLWTNYKPEEKFYYALWVSGRHETIDDGKTNIPSLLGFRGVW